MSTTHEMFTDDQLDEFVEDLKEWPNSMYGNDAAVHSVTPFVSFYFFYDPERYVETSMAMVDIHEEFERLAGHPYKFGSHPDSERPHPYGSKRLPDLREFARKVKVDKQFVFNFTDEPNHASSPATAGYFWRSSDWGNGDPDYSTIHFYYRWQWWQDNRDAWRRFVLGVIDRLNPQQVYSGFAMANPLEFGTRMEVGVWERSLATRFYGLDIDDAFGMRGDLLRGIRPPTWAFFLSDTWRERLSMRRDEVRAALADPRIRIEARPGGLWIELGPQPELYPVEAGVPPLPMMLDRVLRPIRHDDLDLVGMGQWEGDPNARFTRADARRWLGRFQAESDWPSAEVRRAPAPPAMPAAEATDAAMASPAQARPVREPPAPPHVPPLPPPPRTPGGEACPRAGWWFTPAQAGSRRRFAQGETMPVIAHSAWGDTLWQWDRDQSDDGH